MWTLTLSTIALFDKFLNDNVHTLNLLAQPNGVTIPVSFHLFRVHSLAAVHLHTDSPVYTELMLRLMFLTLIKSCLTNVTARMLLHTATSTHTARVLYLRMWFISNQCIFNWTYFRLFSSTHTSGDFFVEIPSVTINSMGFPWTCDTALIWILSAVVWLANKAQTNFFVFRFGLFALEIIHLSHW